MRRIVEHLPTVFQHFTKSLDFRERKMISVCEGDSYVYADQESPLDALSLPLFPAPLVVFEATKPSTLRVFILEMTSANETSPED